MILQLIFSNKISISKTLKSSLLHLSIAMDLFEKVGMYLSTLSFRGD